MSKWTLRGVIDVLFVVSMIVLWVLAVAALVKAIT